ncbi:hypothetical protein HOLleu_04141 [Holothuria leucospilota]|uniref:Uncharacterized protein n=1 Tax=Holothuria leucospilota TaxID=206669 RepID=A0A9Q1HM82_HOLLE|nr:hypothetical protein HOLleu_04141 [Holothuria leucospilota]
MKDTLERKDISLYEKVDLYNQILQRYLDADKRKTSKPIGIKISKSPDDKDDKADKADNDDAALTPEEVDLKSDVLLKNYPKSLKNKAKLLLDRISDNRKIEENPVID